MLTALALSISNVSYAREAGDTLDTYEDTGQEGITEPGQNTQPNGDGASGEEPGGPVEESQQESQTTEDLAQSDGSQPGGTQQDESSQGQTEQNQTGQDQSQQNQENLQTEENESREQSQQDENSDGYVIWGRGRGITPSTLKSDNDRFAPISSGLSVVNMDGALKSKLDSYVGQKDIEGDFGSLVNQGQIKGTSTAFYEYEKGMVVTSQHGTFSIELPMLNTFLAGGGLEGTGAPLAEQTAEDGRIRQKFEKGTLSCAVKTNPDTLAVRRGNTYYFKNTLGDGQADKVVQYGRSSDTVLVGDWDGDGQDTLCVRRGNTYYFKNSMTGGEADSVAVYGRSADDVLVGDWDGDGRDTLCVRRGNVYYFKNDISGGTADAEIPYGRRTDDVLIGDWDADGLDTLSVRRGNIYYFKNSITAGAADAEITYGRKADKVLVGDWNGDRKDTLCVRRGNTYYIKNSIENGTADQTVYYGRSNDMTYAGKWASGAKEEVPAAQNLSFNQSHGFSYSQLTQAFAGNSVNAASFRKSAITTYIDGNGSEIQYCAYYDSYGTIVLAKRVNEGQWVYQWTDFTGDFADAHNVTSLAVDGAGYLHMAWSEHSGQLMYARSVSPGSMTMEEAQMIGNLEERVTYPEFYVQPSGDLFFLYRNGTSGNGNIVLNRYSTASGTWQRVQDNLISGEGKVSPYWQACVDSVGRLHISWVWRETGNVVTNYNMSYAVSTDASGTTFVSSSGGQQNLPITEATGEVICRIPKNSSLINQTSMTVDGENKPYIISYWRVDGVVQYNVVRFTGEKWIIYNTDIRTTDFDLAGLGTRQLPCARPQILVDGIGDDADIHVLFRDDERGGRASIAKLKVQGTEIITEKMIDLTDSSMEEWEPNFDIALWNQKRKLHIFLQKEYFNPDGAGKRNDVENIYVVNATSFLNE